MLTDTCALDNVSVEIGRLQIWYDLTPRISSQMAEELKAIPDSELFPDYQEQGYSEHGAHLYIYTTLRDKDKALMKEGDFPYDTLLYWASRSRELDVMISAYQRIDGSSCPHFRLFLPSESATGSMREQWFMNRVYENKRYILDNVYWCLLATATVNLREAVDYFRQNLYELPKIQRYDTSPLPGATYCQFVEWAQGKGISRLKQGGSNPEKDKIEATKAACELVLQSNIIGKVSYIRRDDFVEMVQITMNNNSQSDLFQLSAARQYFRDEPRIATYKSKGRPHKSP